MPFNSATTKAPTNISCFSMTCAHSQFFSGIEGGLQQSLSISSQIKGSWLVTEYCDQWKTLSAKLGKTDVCDFRLPAALWGYIRPPISNSFRLQIHFFLSADGTQCTHPLLDLKLVGVFFNWFPSLDHFYLVWGAHFICGSMHTLNSSFRLGFKSGHSPSVVNVSLFHICISLNVPSCTRWHNHCC